MLITSLFSLLAHQTRSALMRWRAGKPEQDPREEAKRLTLRALRCGFRAFRDSAFRKHVGFDTLPHIEQDRMFNELAVSAAVYPNMFIKETAPLLPPERQPYWYSVSDALSPTLHNALKEFGIEKEPLKLWEKVYTMRFEEYELNEQDIREHLREHDSLSRYHSAARAQTRINAVALGTLFHIERGRGKKNDPLVPYLLRWVSDQDEFLFHRFKLGLTDLAR